MERLFSGEKFTLFQNKVFVITNVNYTDTLPYRRFFIKISLRFGWLRKTVSVVTRSVIQYIAESLLFIVAIYIYIYIYYIYIYIHIYMYIYITSYLNLQTECSIFRAFVFGVEEIF